MELLVLFFVLVSICGRTTCTLNPRIHMRLTNSGFHRDLQYTISLYSSQLEGCRFMVEQNLPSSVYVSVDELSDLHRFGKLQFFVKNRINIEAPAEKSKSFDVLLYSNVAKNDTVIVLPIHYRYHSPALKGFMKVEINEPKLYLHCSTETFSQVTFIEKVKRKCKDTIEPCEWYQIEYQAFADNLSANIPVGNVKSITFVKLITIFTTIIACYFLLMAILKSGKRLKIKLS